MRRPKPLAEAGSSFDSDSSGECSPNIPNDMLGTEGAVRNILNAKRPCLHSPVCIALQLVLISVLTVLLALPALLYVLFVRLVPCTPIPASLPHSIHTVIRGRRWAERAKRRVTARASACAALAVQRGCAPSPSGTELQQLQRCGQPPLGLADEQGDGYGDGYDGESSGENDMESGRGGGLFTAEGVGPPRPPETRHPACDWQSLHAGLCWLTGPHQPSRPTVVYVHGWEPGTTARGFRETLNWRANTRHTGIGVTAELVPDVDALPLWAARGWNVAIFYWNQLADDTLPEAERKIHSAVGTSSPGEGMRWQRRRQDGTTVHAEAAADTPCVAEMLARAIEPMWRCATDEQGGSAGADVGGMAGEREAAGQAADAAEAAAEAAALGQRAGVAATGAGAQDAGVPQAGVEAGLGGRFGAGVEASALSPQIEARDGNGDCRGCIAGGGRADGRGGSTGRRAAGGSSSGRIVARPAGAHSRGSGCAVRNLGVARGSSGMDAGCRSPDDGGGRGVASGGFGGAGGAGVFGGGVARRDELLSVRQLRLVGHSLGAQLVLEATCRLLSRQPPRLRKHLPLSEVGSPSPLRLVLLDPFFSTGAKPYLPHGRTPAQQAEANLSSALRTMPTLPVECYRASLLGDPPLCASLLSHLGAPTPGLHDLTAFSYVMPPGVHPLSPRARHIAASNLYFLFIAQPEDPSLPWDGRMHPSASDADVRSRMRTRIMMGWPTAPPPALPSTPLSSSASIGSSRRSSSPLLSPSRHLCRTLGSLGLTEEEEDLTLPPLVLEPVSASDAASPTAQLVGPRRPLPAPHHAPLLGLFDAASAATLHLSAALTASADWALPPSADPSSPGTQADGEARTAAGNSDRGRGQPLQP